MLQLKLAGLLVSNNPAVRASSARYSGARFWSDEDDCSHERQLRRRIRHGDRRRRASCRPSRHVGRL